MMRLFTFWLATWFSGSAMAIDFSDWERESRAAEEIESQLFVGAPVWLQVGDRSIFAIATEADSEPVRGTVVLVHGSGGHANWVDVIQPLRVALSEHGYHNLSVQMPYSSEEEEKAYPAETFAHTNARIRAAVNYAAEHFTAPVIVIGHSRGGMQVVNFAATQPASVSAIAFIGSSGSYPRFPEAFHPAGLLKSITVPVLDLYGSKDLDRVVASASDRKAAATSAKYQQIMIDEADHMWQGEESMLTEHVLQWLGSL